MGKVARSQLNISNLKVDMKGLVEAVKSSLEALNYDVDDPKYKYHGKPEEINEVQSNVVGEKKVDNYTMFKIEVEINIRSAKPFIEKGKKLITGEGKIILRSDLIFDYDNKWSKDPILHFLKGVYEKYIYRQTIKNFEVDVSNEMFGVRDEIKSIVKMR
ncbi:MAG: hypothetical protein JW791_02625 [Nanoarchaeota archaeon]|nr:hypothetical protein [Nanoarchaeota archaeon]